MSYYIWLTNATKNLIFNSSIRQECPKTGPKRCTKTIFGQPVVQMTPMLSALQKLVLDTHQLINSLTHSLSNTRSTPSRRVTWIMTVWPNQTVNEWLWVTVATQLLNLTLIQTDHSHLLKWTALSFNKKTELFNLGLNIYATWLHYFVYFYSDNAHQ